MRFAWQPYGYKMCVWNQFGSLFKDHGLFFAVKHYVPFFVGSDGAGAEASTFRMNLASTKLLASIFYDVNSVRGRVGSVQVASERAIG